MAKGSFLVKNSLKQLMRTPVKTALFFMLIGAVSLLLVVSASILIETSERIAAAEDEFVTLATVEQPRDSGEMRPVWSGCRDGYAEGAVEMLNIDVFQELLGPEVLNFEGAGYVQEPEMRPYYMSYMPDYIISFNHHAGYSAVSEFTVLRQLDEKRFLVRLERNLYELKGNGVVMDRHIYDMLTEGAEVSICTHNQRVPQEFEPGKRYIGTLEFDQYNEKGGWDAESLVLFTGPFSTQVDPDTLLAAESGAVPMANNLWYEDGAWSCIEKKDCIAPTFSELAYADEVTDGFYEEGGRGQLWQNWAQVIEQLLRLEKYFTVIPTNSLDLLPSFHDHSVILTGGRAITDEEFDSGARVCLVSRAFLGRNYLDIGDKLPLSLVYSTYGQHFAWDSSAGFGGSFSPLDADGQPYEPFWEAEYEIVGAYDMPFSENFQYVLDTGKEIKGDSIIIPSRSVEASDRNNIAYFAPMNAQTASFIIPNGTVEEFDQRLHEAVPEAAKLKITYDDSGYSKVMESLNSAKLSGLLLFLTALFAGLAVVALLLYFFVIKERKRTAIERGLGLTNRQCRMSLVSGIAIIALAASLLGSAGGAALIGAVELTSVRQEETAGEYSLAYSTWAKAEDNVEFEDEVRMPWEVYAAAPLVLTGLIVMLAAGIAERGMGAEPIYLLSGKG